MQLFLYGFLIFLTALVGGLLPLLGRLQQDFHLRILVSFGAGLLLGMSCIHMIPEAAHIAPNSFGAFLLLGFLILFVLERFVMVHACEEHGCHYHTVGLAAFFGLTVHGIIEGVALTSTLAATTLGPVVLMAILAHKAPCGIALTSLLRLSKKKTIHILLFVSGVALSGPLGMLLAHFLLVDAHSHVAAGSLLALSSGTFLYISACDLLPELHHHDTEKFVRLGAFFVGIFLSYLGGHLLE